MKYVLRCGHEVSPPGPICGGVFEYLRHRFLSRVNRTPLPLFARRFLRSRCCPSKRPFFRMAPKIWESVSRTMPGPRLAEQGIESYSYW